MKKYKKDYKEYSVYRTMIYSCYPSKNRTTYYEIHKIGVCDEWRGPDGFWRFLEDVGTKPSDNHRLRRIDTNKGFYPYNCEWSTDVVKNNRGRIIITYNNETKSLREWCCILGLEYHTCYKRYRNNKSIEEVFFGGNKIFLFYRDEKLSLKEVSEKYNIKKNTLYSRYKSGWNHSDIIETPVNEIPISLRTKENMKYGPYSGFLASYFNKNKNVS